ncbi:MAG: methyltransferase [Terriglobia bacterium]
MSAQTLTDKKRWEWLEAKAYTAIIGDFDPPSFFAEVMAEAAPIEPGKTRLLDIGCGCGIIGIYCLIKRKANFVTFDDIQSKAIAVTFANLDWHIQQGNIQESQVASLKAGFADIPASVVAQHDLIAFNPPQLPWNYVTPEYRKEIEASSHQRIFRDGGSRGDGLQFVEKFLEWYGRLGSPKPNAVIVLSSFLGKSLIESTIAQHKLEWELLQEPKRVPLRQILAQSAEGFTEAERNERSLRRAADGKWTKELLAILLCDR